MRFWYYLYGLDVGTLEVLIRQGDTKTSKWKETGDNSEFWHGSEVLIDQRSSTAYSYIFQVTSGSSFKNGSIAIDDIAWLRGSGEITDAAPLNDTTFGNQFGTYLYVHVVQTWAANPKPARLLSPYFPAAKQRCINYWNFRNGTNFDGALTVSIYNDAIDEITESCSISLKKNLEGGTMNSLDDLTVYEGACKPIEDRKPDFTCEDGDNHISDDYRCDFYNDCADGSDEKGCGTNCDFETEEPNPCNWVSSTTNNVAAWRPKH
ncbi:MAM and LDL-receptor class A domain-containing protein 2 [Caerostris extrusa]|uniref:MAM and LDL-receptor class A domain-containing protein 2 n=1 Tax=Caerostris extrusa TaxID=172846 RepID=A0AAV4MVH1_CAEEX|nr:MAM and LDL-receptor class A domain-containing protein 2 [Caerostris extrusa]